MTSYDLQAPCHHSVGRVVYYSCVQRQQVLIQISGPQTRTPSSSHTGLLLYSSLLPLFSMSCVVEPPVGDDVLNQCDGPDELCSAPRCDITSALPDEGGGGGITLCCCHKIKNTIQLAEEVKVIVCTRLLYNKTNDKSCTTSYIVFCLIPVFPNQTTFVPSTHFELHVYSFKYMNDVDTTEKHIKYLERDYTAVK